MSKQRRVVITGMGILSPIGLTVESYWEGLKSGMSGAAPITQFDASRIDTKFACELKNFDITEYLDKKSARRLDVFAQYAAAAAAQALASASIDVNALSIEEKEATGVTIGSGIGGIKVFYEQALTNEHEGPRRVSPFFIPMLIADIAGGFISIRYGFKGPNYCSVSACATANNNIIDAYLLIKEGMASVMLTGGSEASICELALAGFNSSKALSTRNDTPQTASRPFDATRDGFVMGEGAGVLVLEDLDHALARNAFIYGEIIGVGLSADAYHITAPDPEGGGAALAMKRAIASAGINLTDVDYINMHGTSTGLGDIAETKAIKSVFGEHARTLNLSSTKSMIGHLLGAAGAVEAIATLLSMQNGIIPPTINFEHPDPECDLNYTFNTAVKRDVEVALSNAFGFGGHNTTIVFKKFHQN